MDKFFASLFFLFALILVGASILIAFEIDPSMPYSEISPILYASFKPIIGALIAGFLGMDILTSSREFTR